MWWQQLTWLNTPKKNMKYTESGYVNLGARYERATPQRARAIAQLIRSMLEKETPDDRTLARKLIERGRADAR